MFDHYLGSGQGEAYSDPMTRQGCALWLERVQAYYGEDRQQVDLAIIDNMLPLTAETADYIYSKFSPPITYRRGTRPELEKVVDAVVKPGMGERDRALALMRRCRDNPLHGQIGNPRAFNGGSEEELVKRGAIMCNEISRLYACLAQVAGLQCRTYSAHISGHMMNEVKVDGRWWWVDVMFGAYCYADDGGPASAWDLLRDPTLFNRQKRATLVDLRTELATPVAKFPAAHPRAKELELAFRWCSYRDWYFNPKEAAAIANYSVNDFGKFTYPWRGNTDADSADAGRVAVARHKLANLMPRMGWPTYYYNSVLFDDRIVTAD